MIGKHAQVNAALNPWLCPCKGHTAGMLVGQAAECEGERCMSPTSSSPPWNWQALSPAGLLPLPHPQSGARGRREEIH